jgi:hypothetical protein
MLMSEAVSLCSSEGTTRRDFYYSPHARTMHCSRMKDCHLLRHVYKSRIKLTLAEQLFVNFVI